MADVFTRSKRSEIMSKIRSTGTKPEVTVAAMLARTRLKVEEQAVWLPGRPDFIIKSKRIAVFVHGCFWHQHEACGAAARSSKLAKRDEFWRTKFENNRLRDARAVRRLRKNGWRILTIWECEIRAGRASTRLRSFLSRPTRSGSTGGTRKSTTTSRSRSSRSRSRSTGGTSR